MHRWMLVLELLLTKAAGQMISKVVSSHQCNGFQELLGGVI